MDKIIIDSRSQAVKIVYELRQKLEETYFDFLDETDPQKTASVISKEFERDKQTDYQFLPLNRDFINSISTTIESLVDFIINTNDKELANYLLTCGEAFGFWEYKFFKLKLDYQIFEKINIPFYLLDDFFNCDGKPIGMPCVSTNQVSERLLEIFRRDEKTALSFISEAKGLKAAHIARKAYKAAINGKIDIYSIHRPLYKELKHLGIINVSESAWNNAIISEETRQKEARL